MAEVNRGLGQNLRFERYIGAEIAQVFEPLAKLRITVFRDFPYLYEGDLAYEQAYLQTYSKATRAFLFAVYDGAEMVGATTGIPLADETEEVQRPFIQAAYDLNQVFYFGESILLKPYRGLGLGNRFFDEREQYAASLNTFQYTAFCAVQRADNHPAMPVEYKPLDAFWQNRGYRKAPQLQTTFDWLDIGEAQSTHKSMQFWLRQI
jgi:GNAT superfamily N-acetyltransferase